MMGLITSELLLDMIELMVMLDIIRKRTNSILHFLLLQ